MDYEKKYKEAFERAKKFYEQGTITESLSYIFPELKKSEDEKIKEDLIQWINEFPDTIWRGHYKKDVFAWLKKQKVLTAEEDLQGKEDVLWCIKQAKKHAKDENEMGTCWFAEKWLEKQCDQKVGKWSERDIYIINNIYDFVSENTIDVNRRSAANECLDWLEWLKHQDKHELVDKRIEQKTTDKSNFHIGDWITFCGDTAFKIIKIETEDNGILDYLLLDQNGHNSFYNKKYVDENARLWTIQDAKDGNVLAVEGRRPFIFKDFSDISRTIVAYCGINGFDKFEISACNQWWTSCKVCPATKKQRNTLMTAMAGAGYTFDFDKKVLKKIEYEMEIPFNAKDSELQEVTYYIPKGFHAEIYNDKVVIKKGEKPTAWSEEDEKMIEADLQFAHEYGRHGLWCWLKSLKQRMNNV